MKITLYNAISADGFIARSNYQTDWVLDTEGFEKSCREAGCFFIGRKTYEEIGVIEGTLNVVLSKKTFLRNKNENVVFARNADEAIKIAVERGFESPLLVGGASSNASFLKENKIDEVILIVHPIFLGSGIKLFNNIESDKKLELISTNNLDEGLVQLRYKVVKE